MALITTYQHFVGRLDIPNSSPTLASGEALADNIDKYEEQYLRRILGYALYELLQTNIAAGSGIYHSLRTGAEYTDRAGNTEKWDGFSHVGFNPIANYIYVQHQSETFTNTSGVGERKANSENMQMANPWAKIVQAWNEMVESNRNLHEFLYANQTDYPDYLGLTYPPQNRIPPGCSITERKYQALFIKMNPYGI